jgi:hypothetical protein
MERPAWAPQGIDISVLSVSRMHDRCPGGSHNSEVDGHGVREAGEFGPELSVIMEIGGAFARRVSEYAPAGSAGRFGDSCPGIPVPGKPGGTAHARAGGTRLTHVVPEPAPVARGRAVTDGVSGAGTGAGEPSPGLGQALAGARFTAGRRPALLPLPRPSRDSSGLARAGHAA